MYDSRPTFEQAVAEYRKQYDAGDVEVVPLPGSKWAKAASLEDEFGEMAYGEDVELALREVEARAEAEKAYQAVLQAHGFA